MIVKKLTYFPVQNEKFPLKENCTNFLCNKRPNTIIDVIVPIVKRIIYFIIQYLLLSTHSQRKKVRKKKSLKKILLYF